MMDFQLGDVSQWWMFYVETWSLCALVLLETCSSKGPVKRLNLKTISVRLWSKHRVKFAGVTGPLVDSDEDEDSFAQCEAPVRYLSWCITTITMVYGIYNYSYWGESKPTNITGGPHIAGLERASVIEVLRSTVPVPPKGFTPGRVYLCGAVKLASNVSRFKKSYRTPPWNHER